MRETESIKEYADRMMKVVSEIRILGEELEDRQIVQRIVVSIPARFEQKVCSLEDCKDLKVMGVSELINALHNAEMRQNLRSNGGTEIALGADFKRKTKLGGSQTSKPVDRFSTTKKSSRQDFGSSQKVMQGAGL